MENRVVRGVYASATLLYAGMIGACSAAANPPPSFPDIRNLPTVNARNFSGKAYGFATPDGVTCESAGWNPYFQWTCVGPAGTGSAQLDLGTYARENNTPATIGESRPWADPSSYPLLPINHQVQIAVPVRYKDGATATLICATPGAKTTACLVDDALGRHGFVLSPERNWAF